MSRRTLFKTVGITGLTASLSGCTNRLPFIGNNDSDDQDDTTSNDSNDDNNDSAPQIDEDGDTPQPEEDDSQDKEQEDQNEDELPEAAQPEAEPEDGRDPEAEGDNNDDNGESENGNSYANEEPATVGEDGQSTKTDAVSIDSSLKTNTQGAVVTGAVTNTSDTAISTLDLEVTFTEGAEQVFVNYAGTNNLDPNESGGFEVWASGSGFETVDDYSIRVF